MERLRNRGTGLLQPAVYKRASGKLRIVCLMPRSAMISSEPPVQSHRAAPVRRQREHKRVVGVGLSVHARRLPCASNETGPGTYQGWR
eukprot:13860840-Ditylum_brightwellii.AAC.1